MFFSWLVWGDEFGEDLWGETPFLSHRIESMSSTGFITINVDLHHLATDVFNFLAVLVFLQGLSLVAASAVYSSLRCRGFSLWWLLLWRTALGRTGFSSHGTWAEQAWSTGLVARNMWNLPRPGSEPLSPALAGGFFTTKLPGKSERFVLERQLFRPRC